MNSNPEVSPTFTITQNVVGVSMTLLLQDKSYKACVITQNRQYTSQNALSAPRVSSMGKHTRAPAEASHVNRTGTYLSIVQKKTPECLLNIKVHLQAYKTNVHG